MSSGARFTWTRPATRTRGDFLLFQMEGKVFPSRTSNFETLWSKRGVYQAVVKMFTIDRFNNMVNYRDEREVGLGNSNVRYRWYL